MKSRRASRSPAFSGVAKLATRRSHTSTLTSFVVVAESMAVPGWGCWWWDSNPQGLAPVGIADATLPLVRRGPMEKWSGEVSPDHVPRYTCAVPARSSGSEELLNPRVRALGHQRPGPTSHRH